MIHENSLDSWKMLDKTSRQVAILNVYTHALAPLTDRQVKDELQLPDMNCVRPRISEMVDADPPRLREAGKIRDPITGRTVRTVTIARFVQRTLL